MTFNKEIQFKCCLINLMVPVLPPVKYYGQFKRLNQLPDFIDEMKNAHMDIIVVNELIPDYVQVDTIEKFKKGGYPYHTKQIKGKHVENGGIMLFSQHPIVEEEHQNFGGLCDGSDCFCCKGVVYAKVIKDQAFPLNVFATHLQAWDNPHNIHTRLSQVKKIKEFIDKIKISNNEPVTLIGDFNIDRNDQKQVSEITSILQVKIPSVAPDSHPYTFDSQNNQLVGLDDPGSYRNQQYPNGCEKEHYKSGYCACCPQKWFDYITYSTQHLQPKKSYISSYYYKTKQPFSIQWSSFFKTKQVQDLSDHFPVIAQMTFDTSQLNRYHISGTNQNTSNTIYIGVSIFVILIIAVIMICFIRSPRPN